MIKTPACPLCALHSHQLLWSNQRIHIIAVNDSGFPGYTRVIWAQHQAEMTDLPVDQRAYLMQAVWQVERAQRDILQPDKVNLAQLGNMVPHLHWHVIPRWTSDTHFPDAIWANPSVAGLTTERAMRWQQQQDKLHNLLPAYHDQLISSLNKLA